MKQVILIKRLLKTFHIGLSVGLLLWSLFFLGVDFVVPEAKIEVQTIFSFLNIIFFSDFTYVVAANKNNKINNLFLFILLIVLLIFDTIGIIVVFKEVEMEYHPAIILSHMGFAFLFLYSHFLCGQYLLLKYVYEKEMLKIQLK
jgi:hypothetical protein